MRTGQTVIGEFLDSVRDADPFKKIQIMCHGLVRIVGCFLYSENTPANANQIARE
jgi:hypothetical protein